MEQQELELDFPALVKKEEEKRQQSGKKPSAGEVMRKLHE
jgi:hypothetical protein